MPCESRFDILLDHVRYQTDEVNVDHGHDRRVRANEGARVEIAFAHEPIDGRDDVRVFQIDLELVETRPGLRELSLCEIDLSRRGFIPGFRIVERLPGDELP